MSELIRIVLALALTVVVECGLSLAFRSKQLMLAVLLGNLLTNPLLNFALLLYIAFSGQYYYAVLGVLELSAVVVETLVIKLMTECSALKAALLALLFNASSFCAGLLFW